MSPRTSGDDCRNIVVAVQRGPFARVVSPERLVRTIAAQFEEARAQYQALKVEG